jgi:hypothetical protein
LGFFNGASQGHPHVYGIGSINVSLGPLLQYIEISLRSYVWLSFQHIYKEPKFKANKLSKESLLLSKGAFGYYEYIDGEEKEARVSIVIC